MQAEEGKATPSEETPTLFLTEDELASVSGGVWVSGPGPLQSSPGPGFIITPV
jgi:bacteriocin-like protein